jgi:arylsulfatase A-like enzyme
MTKIKSGLFGYLVFLTGIFLLLEVSFFMQRSGFYLGDFKMVSLHLTVPSTVLPGILFFISAQLFLHWAFVCVIWGVTRLIGVALNCTWQTIQTLGFSTWAFSLLTLLIANEYYFPNSCFADLVRSFIPQVFSRALFTTFAIVCAMGVALALAGLIKLIMQTLPILSRMIVGVIFLTSAAGFAIHHQEQRVVDAASTEKPNIIVIGVDSLRPDFLGFLGGDKITPHMDDFLKQAIVFAQAVTPQARTFPAWMSILSGEYPSKIGARYDLVDRSLLTFHHSLLPEILQQHGYETIFATDETRFSNIDESYGFDRTISPPVGFNDFLLGTLNDFPLSNFVVNTSLGKWMFPHSYGNRAVFITYNPDSFLKMLQPQLERSRAKPLFLAVHFCLPHFPYFWSSYSYTFTPRAVPHYYAAVQRSDQQVGDFLTLLAQNGILKHSIVFLVSDHGEAMEMHGDRITDRDIAGKDNKKKIVPHFYPTAFDFEKVNQSAGHGTDVLSMTQYHVVMAVRLYGMQSTQPKIIPNLVSLLDIQPTILSLIGILSQPVDGVSLKNFMVKNATPTQSVATDMFLESDFSPQSVRSVHPEARKVLFEGIDFFSIDPVTTRLTVKKAMGDLIISSKQYADIYQSWILALYPQPDGFMMPILVDLKTGQWTNDLSTPFAQKSPARRMRLSLQKFYGQELTKIDKTPKSVS